MRTTVALDARLVARAREISTDRTLSALLDRCLADWIARHTQKEIDARLAEEYRQGRAASRRATRHFITVDPERWPSW
jgi:hypothetical protein